MTESVLLVISIISAILALLSAAFSCFTYFKNVKHDRRRDTLDAYNKLQNEAFDNLNKNSPSQIRIIAEDPTSDEYKEISGYVARIEHFCAGVNLGIYDRKTVYALANGYLDGNAIISRITPIIEKKHRSAEKDYYKNTHKVLEWMRKESASQRNRTRIKEGAPSDKGEKK